MGITLSLITNCKERRVKLMLESCEFFLFIYVKQCPVNYETINYYEPWICSHREIHIQDFTTL